MYYKRKISKHFLISRTKIRFSILRLIYILTTVNSLTIFKPKKCIRDSLLMQRFIYRQTIFKLKKKIKMLMLACYACYNHVFSHTFYILTQRHNIILNWRSFFFLQDINHWLNIKIAHLNTYGSIKCISCRPSPMPFLHFSSLLL